MCGIESIIAGGASIVGGLLAKDGADKQADAVRDASADQSAAVNAAINTYNQTSPSAAFSRSYGGELSTQIATMLGLGGGGTATNTGGGGGQARQALAASNPGQAYLSANPGVLQAWTDAANGNDPHGIISRFGTPEAFGSWHRDTFAVAEGRPLSKTAPEAVMSGNPYAGQSGRDIILGPDQTVQMAQPTGDGSRSYGDTLTTNAAGEMVRSLPGYDFQFNEGMRAVTEGLNGANSLYSGKALKELTKYGQKFAETKYQTHLSNMFQAAGFADSASVNTLNATTGNAAQTASAQIAAAGHVNDGNASLIGGITGAAGAIASGIAQPTAPDVNAIGDGNGGFTFNQNGQNNLGRVA